MMVTDDNVIFSDPYVELTLPDFLKLYPWMILVYPLNKLIPHLINDPDYRIRIRGGQVEIGYPGDFWRIT